MADRIAIDAQVVRSRIEALKAAYPEIEEDAELLADSIEGMTDFDRVLDRVVDAFLDTVSMKTSIAERASALKERGDRFDRKADAYRSLAHGLMEVAGKTLHVLPQATLSIRKGLTSVAVDDEQIVPQGFCRIERVPIKAEIKKALEAGSEVPGARLVTGAPSLSVRTK
jgi:hypothetical protein